MVPGSTDGSPVVSEPITGLPVGAECTVTEIDNGGADVDPAPVTVTIEENEQANVAFVGVNNPFSAGTIAVAKVIDGTAVDVADPDNIPELSYTIEVECATEGIGGALQTLLDTAVTVAGDGVPVTVVDDAGAPVLLPLGRTLSGDRRRRASAPPR